MAFRRFAVDQMPTCTHIHRFQEGILKFSLSSRNVRVPLLENAKLSLMRLGILIQRNPDSEFVIEGHSDTRGTVEYNQVLSERRAYAVRDWLLHSLRIDADNIRAVGRGKSRPLTNPDGSIEEQALNRRVEIIINKRVRSKTRA